MSTKRDGGQRLRRKSNHEKEECSQKQDHTGSWEIERNWDLPQPHMIHSHSSPLTKAQRGTAESYFRALGINSFQMWLTFSLINLMSLPPWESEANLGDNSMIPEIITWIPLQQGLSGSRAHGFLPGRGLRWIQTQKEGALLSRRWGSCCTYTEQGGLYFPIPGWE